VRPRVRHLSTPFENPADVVVCHAVAGGEDGHSVNCTRLMRPIAFAMWMVGTTILGCSSPVPDVRL
jgi:hypothetical protein